MAITRRRVLTTVACAGALAAPFLRPSLLSATEGTLETKTLTLAKTPALCTAPQFITEELLRAEGFTEIRFIDTLPPDVPTAVAQGKLDFSMAYASQYVAALDAGEPLTLLAGIMVGCFELFAHEGVRSIGELKGKSVGVQGLGSMPHTLITLMAAQVGLDPKTDIQWVTDAKLKPIELFAAGKSTRFSAFRRSRRTYAPAKSATSSSTPRRIVHGPNTSAVCFQATATSCASIRWRQSEWCAQSSRQPICVPASRNAPPGSLSRLVLPAVMTTRCRRCAITRTTNGASTIPRTRCASTRCGCTRSD
jgi:hypothetical protein